MYCDTMDFVEKVRGQELALDHVLTPDHGLVLEISDYLFKSVIISKFEAVDCSKIGHS